MSKIRKRNFTFALAKGKEKKDAASLMPPSKKAAIEEYSSFDESENENKVPCCNENSHKKNEILSIEMMSKSLLKVNPGNWINHFDIFENNFVDFLNESVETSNSVPAPLTIDDVKSLIDSSISSKIESLLKTSVPIISSPTSNFGVKSFANIAN